MSNKGLAERHKEGRAHVYKASLDVEKTRKNIVSELLDKLFDGSSGKLVMQALSAKPASSDELDKIRRLLDSMKGEEK
jgi:predicted transcriptional regulator